MLEQRVREGADAIFTASRGRFVGTLKHYVEQVVGRRRSCGRGHGMSKSNQTKSCYSEATSLGGRPNNSCGPFTVQLGVASRQAVCLQPSNFHGQELCHEVFSFKVCSRFGEIAIQLGLEQTRDKSLRLVMFSNRAEPLLQLTQFLNRIEPLE